MLKNRKSASDMIAPAPQVILLYGPPNAGKTTICATAKDNLFLDFERSLVRSDLVSYVADRVDVDRWEDVAEIGREDLDGVKAVTIDTAGEMIQMLATYVRQQGGPMSNRDGSISLKGYGKIGDIFTAWHKRIRDAGCHLLLTAHAKEEKTATEDVEIRPDIMGQTSKIIAKAASAIGYVVVRGKNQNIHWRPAEWWAKGPREWSDPMPVPDLKTSTSWFQGKIDELGTIEQQRQKAAREAFEALEPFRQQVGAVKVADDANKALAAAEKLDESIRPAAKKILWECAQNSGLTFDRQTKQFVEAKQ
jgi:hypothetical protein